MLKNYLKIAYRNILRSKKYAFLNITGLAVGLAACLLTVFVAGLGIFGLASYSVEQRTKEIGIRKVLGSSSLGIVSLLTKSYTRWVLAANLIAWPAAYYAANHWLQGFAYRTSIGVEPFLIARVLTLAVP